MSFTADQIEVIVKKLLNLKKTCNGTDIDLMEEFNDFKIKNKMFYEMILSESGFDLPVFKEMMKMKRKLESGEDQYSVDVKFGQYMATKYVDPVVNKIPK